MTTSSSTLSPHEEFEAQRQAEKMRRLKEVKAKLAREGYGLQEVEQETRYQVLDDGETIEEATHTLNQLYAGMIEHQQESYEEIYQACMDGPAWFDIKTDADGELWLSMSDLDREVGFQIPLEAIDDLFLIAQRLIAAAIELKKSRVA
jgi:hypothetical protein